MLCTRFIIYLRLMLELTHIRDKLKIDERWACFLFYVLMAVTAIISFPPKRMELEQLCIMTDALQIWVARRQVPAQHDPKSVHNLGEYGHQ